MTKKLGPNIKRLREKKSITLRNMAEKIGTSASFWSQVESGKVNPSISTLLKIAANLNTSAGVLLDDQTTTSFTPFIRKQNRRAEEFEGGKLEFLTSYNSKNVMDIVIFKLRKNLSVGGKKNQHFGQEFILLLTGKIEVVLQDNKYILEKGDSVYFDSSINHEVINIVNGQSKILWAVTPPSF